MEKKEELQKIDKEECIIMVPENIKFRKHCRYGDGLGIVFNNEKQVLYYMDYIGVVHVAPDIYPSSFIKYKLVPIKQKDRKVGYTYFRSDTENPDFTILESYCKYLGENQYFFVTVGRDILTRWYSCNYWWQVVPLEGEQ